MSEVAPIIAQLRSEGLELRIVGGRLKVDPSDLISVETDVWLRQHAREVKSFLADEQKAVGLPHPNTTPVPDIFFDQIAPRLTERELRVMLYVIRRTFGFKKRDDAISLSQFSEGIITQDGKRLDHGAGVNRRSVIRAVQSLERQGLLEAVRITTCEHGNQASRYRLVLSN
jgi:hypothetical protein